MTPATEPTTYIPPAEGWALLPPRTEPMRDERVRQNAAEWRVVQAFRAIVLLRPETERMVA